MPLPLTFMGNKQLGNWNVQPSYHPNYMFILYLLLGGGGGWEWTCSKKNKQTIFDHFYVH